MNLVLGNMREIEMNVEDCITSMISCGTGNYVASILLIHKVVICKMNSILGNANFLQ